MGRLTEGTRRADGVVINDEWQMDGRMEDGRMDVERADRWRE